MFAKSKWIFTSSHIILEIRVQNVQVYKLQSYLVLLNKT